MTAAAPTLTPSGLPVLGHAWSLYRQPLQLLRQAAQAGDAVAIRRGTHRQVVVNHPDMIHDVLGANARAFVRSREFDRLRVMIGDGLVTSNGDHHHRQRRLAQPAFAAGRITAYTTLIPTITSDQARRWRPGETLDMNAELRAITMRVVTRALFSTGLDDDRVEEITQNFQYLQDRFAVRVLLFPEFLLNAPIPFNRRYLARVARLRGIIDDIVTAYRTAGTDHGDLLSMLLLARDEATNQGMADRGMTDQQLTDEAITMLLAGYETTAALLGWTLYLLTQHPEIAQRLQTEVDTVVGDGPADLEAVQRLPYLRQVLQESLRVYPPVWQVGRRAITDTTAGPLAVPAGTVVMVSPYASHHNPRWFPDPERVDPDRWAPGRPAPPRHVFLPFGGGIHHCIGERLAWAEASIVLATLVAGWRFRLAPGATVRPLAAGSLNPDHLPMILESRHPTASSGRSDR